MEKEQLRFPGFPEKPKENYWQYPEIMNGYWHALTPVEQKVLDYILRHTWGWHKSSDYITYDQFKNGIPNSDEGTGIKSNTTLSRALKGLERKNMIKIASGKEGGIPNMYSLVLIEGSQEVDTPTPKGGQGGSIKCGHTIDNAINTYNKYISKEIVKPLSYGNEDINKILNAFKETTGLLKIDGSDKQNRQYAWLSIKKFGSVDKVIKLINLAYQDDFHRKNLSSLKYIYYNGVKIFNNAKEKAENPSYVKIK